MSRVEENQKVIERIEKDYKEAIEKAGGVQTLLFTNPNIMSLFAEASKNDILVDISKSLAMIADDLHYYRQYESEVIERVEKEVNNA